MFFSTCPNLAQTTNLHNTLFAFFSQIYIGIQKWIPSIVQNKLILKMKLSWDISAETAVVKMTCQMLWRLTLDECIWYKKPLFRPTYYVVPGDVSGHQFTLCWVKSCLCLLIKVTYARMQLTFHIPLHYITCTCMVFTSWMKSRSWKFV